MKGWIIIYEFAQAIDAHMAKNLLESQEIHSILHDELASQVAPHYTNATGGIKLLVSENDYIEAIHTLKQGGYAISETTENSVEVIRQTKQTDKSICPFCGSKDIGHKKTTNAINAILFPIFALFSPIFKRANQCFNCNKVWKYQRSL